METWNDMLGAWTPWLRITDYEMYWSQCGDPALHVRFRFEAYFASMFTASTYPG